MITLRAPYPTLQTLIRLPNPAYSNVRQNDIEIKPRVSMNGTQRTYVKKSDVVKLTHRYELTREAALALREFIRVHFAHKILMLDHNAEQWVVDLANNPFEFTAARRAMRSGGRENMTIELQFEGLKVA